MFDIFSAALIACGVLVFAVWFTTKGDD